MFYISWAIICLSWGWIYILGWFGTFAQAVMQTPIEFDYSLNKIEKNKED